MGPRVGHPEERAGSQAVPVAGCPCRWCRRKTGAVAEAADVAEAVAVVWVADGGCCCCCLAKGTPSSAGTLKQEGQKSEKALSQLRPGSELRNIC